MFTVEGLFFLIERFELVLTCFESATTEGEARKRKEPKPC